MELNNFDYEKFKKEILGGKASAIAPTQEAIEKEKDKRFQDLCKELWPNIYSKIKLFDNYSGKNTYRIMLQTLKQA